MIPKRRPIPADAVRCTKMNKKSYDNYCYGSKFRHYPEDKRRKRRQYDVWEQEPHLAVIRCFEPGNILQQSYDRARIFCRYNEMADNQEY